MRPAIVVLGPSGLSLAKKLSGLLFAEIHGPQGMTEAKVQFDKAVPHIAKLFQAGQPIIGICASGILIRAVAPHLKDKTIEPPVLALAEDGSTIVPLLGGHHGANELARRISMITTGFAAVTTASDVMFGISLDEPPLGYVLADIGIVKPAAAALLAGHKLKLYGDAPWLQPIATEDGRVDVEITHRQAQNGVLTYHPKVLAVGVGCERGTDPQEIQELLEKVLAEHQLAKISIAQFASIDLKEDEAAITALGYVRFFSTKELNAQSSRIQKPSEVVRAEVGTPSVAEAAALCAAGPNAELIVPKTKSKRATIAIAMAPAPILEHVGRTRGTVHVIGIGPGTPDMRSPEATRKLSASSDWVGYDLYLELAKDQYTDQTLHKFPLGGEEDRCRAAITLAKQGKTVALICSGDAGIYAMAALVYELVDLEPCRIEVDVVPGISAFQEASAKAGAMIGHDFCCISLSDLLTPWETIERRLKAAAEGDFVIAFYNPRSLKRHDQISKAFEILKNHRPDSCPVVIASNLGRPEEKVKVINFADFKSEEIDMLTLVMVGSSQSKIIKRGDGKSYGYTPRGYAKKFEQKVEAAE